MLQQQHALKLWCVRNILFVQRLLCYHARIQPKHVVSTIVDTVGAGAVCRSIGIVHAIEPVAAAALIG